MVAPTGVNEELPQEPAKAGQPGTELAEPQAAGAEAAPTQAAEEADEKAAPAAVVPAELVPPQAEPADEERVASAPVEAKPADADATETAPAEAAPAEADAGGAGPAAAEPTEDWDGEESRRDVRPLAVAGIILGVIALVAVAVGVLAVVTHGFRPKTVVTYRPAAVYGLRPGQCIDSGSDALKFTVLSCARPHDAEVFAAFTLPATAWPGASAVRVDAGNGCASRFDSYIDPRLAAASLTQAYVYPNRAAWQAGERKVVCEVSAVNGQLTGSVRASG
jgi:Septum formation